jgi:transmembrane sensor
MMSVDTRLDEEAAEWLVRLEDRDADSRDAKLQARFFEWLRRSPWHLKAFLDSADAFRALDGMDSQRYIDVRALMDERLADVVPLPNGTGVGQSTQGRKKMRSGRSLIAVAATVALVAITVLFPVRPSNEYTTAIGEQRTFKLDDGSVLHLNTRSRAAVHFSPRERKVRLLDGEALFVVERDAHRPFTVEAGRVEIRALGTQFNVYRHDRATTVSVVDGLVQVGSAKLGVGEEAAVIDGQVTKRTKPDVGNAIAWRSRRLVFRDTPLAEVAAEFNRYNKTQIRVEGFSARDKQLTAIFSADHPQSLILYVRKDPQLAIEQRGDAVLIRAR